MGKVDRIFSYQNRTQYILRHNLKRFFEVAKNPAFFTITFKENLKWNIQKDWEEAQRRWNSFTTHMMKKFKYWVCVIEAQKRGSIHYHVICEYDKNISSGMTLYRIQNKKWKYANKNLKSLWKYYRSKMNEYHFGIVWNLVPIIGNPDNVSEYLIRYLVQWIYSDDFKRCFRGRIVRYSKNFPGKNRLNFAWKETPFRDWLKKYIAQGDIDYEKFSNNKEYRYGILEKFKLRNKIDFDRIKLNT